MQFRLDLLGEPRMKEHIAQNAEPRVQKYFDNHRRIGYSRYEVPEEQMVSPIAQEIWAHKTCDNQSVLKTGLAMGFDGRTRLGAAFDGLCILDAFYPPLLCDPAI